MATDGFGGDPDSGLEPERAIDDATPSRPPPMVASSGGTAVPWRRQVDGTHVVGGTVVRAVPPAQGNPYLHLDVNTDDGRTVTVRAGFLSPTRVPAVAEGQHVRITGRLDGSGYLRPDSIENDSTGVRWQRRPRRLILAVAAVLAVIAVLTLVVPRLVGGDGPAAEVATVPAIVGKPLEVARSELRAAGFSNVTEVRQRSAAATLTVVRVLPQPGTRVERASLIQVFFSFPI